MSDEVTALRRQLAEMFDGNGAVKLFIDPQDGAIVDANAAAAAFYGWSAAELRAMNIKDLNQLPAELVEREMARARAQKRTYFEFKHRLKCGEVRDVQVFSGPCTVGDRPLLFSIVVDISERRRLADDLAHAQRMEALGRLAGGVAHDFNNLLTAIDLAAAAAMNRARRGETVETELEELRGVVQRCAGLTGQLLAFCRRQVIRAQLVDVAEMLEQLRPTLIRLLGSGIELAVSVDSRPAPVVGDPSQIEQVVWNLALNARDAMSAGGGRLSIVLDTPRLDDSAAALLGVPAASYVRLRVSDTGIGMAGEQIAHAFEPFYTTKEGGRGTGLGLATVYGIARQSGGSVQVSSAPGQGATFTVWLPLAQEPPAREFVTPPGGVVAAAAPASGATILLAEDDDAIRKQIAELLGSSGYTVIHAADGEAALRAAGRHKGRIDLLLTDVVMPRIGGIELAEKLVQQSPQLHVLFMSGHADSPAVDVGFLGAGERFLAKPFTAEQLLEQIARTLATAPRHPRAR